MGAVIVLLLLILIVVVLNLVITVFSKFELEQIISGINQIIKGTKNGSGNS